MQLPHGLVPVLLESKHWEEKTHFCGYCRQNEGLNQHTLTWDCPTSLLSIDRVGENPQLLASPWRGELCWVICLTIWIWVAGRVGRLLGRLVSVSVGLKCQQALRYSKYLRVFKNKKSQATYGGSEHWQHHRQTLERKRDYEHWRKTLQNIFNWKFKCISPDKSR